MKRLFLLLALVMGSCACEEKPTPLPIPMKIHMNTSRGWELVPIAAMEVCPQKLPMTSVSTVV